MPFVFCILLLQHLGPWWWRRDCQFLEIIKCLPTKLCFIYNIHVDSRPIHSLCPQTTFLIRLSHSRPLSTCPITPEPCIRQLGTVPIPQSPLPLFNPANPILLTLPHPFLSAETTVEALVYVLPPPPLLPDGPRAPWAPCSLQHHGLHHGVVCPLLLGSVSNKLHFQWQSSPDCGLNTPEW